MLNRDTMSDAARVNAFRERLRRWECAPVWKRLLMTYPVPSPREVRAMLREIDRLKDARVFAGAITRHQ